MKIYVVRSWGMMVPWGPEVDGVFSTKAKAEEFLEAVSAKMPKWSGTCIDEYTMDSFEYPQYQEEQEEQEEIDPDYIPDYNYDEED